MKLADGIATLPTQRRVRRCEFGTWLDTLPPDLADKVWDAVISTKPHRDVAAVISSSEDYPYTVSAATIYNHRAGVCATCRSRTT